MNLNLQVLCCKGLGLMNLYFYSPLPPQNVCYPYPQTIQPWDTCRVHIFAHIANHGWGRILYQLGTSIKQTVIWHQICTRFIELSSHEEKWEGSQRKQGLLDHSAGPTPVKERGKESGLDKQNLRLQDSFENVSAKPIRSPQAKVAHERGVLCLTEGAHISILAMLSHWLGTACWKHDLGSNAAMDSEGQQLGPSVNYAPQSKRTVWHIFRASTKPNNRWAWFIGKSSSPAATLT